MRTVILAVIVSTGAALLTGRNSDDVWKIVGEPQVKGEIPLKLSAKQDMKCSMGADKCGDPFVAFFNTVTETCIDKYDAGAECGMFADEVQHKVCKHEYICHNFGDKDHPTKRTCLRPANDEQCKECACGTCVTKKSTFGDSYKECDTSCSLVATEKQNANEHCARATVDATVHVEVTAEHPDGRRGTAVGKATASGQGTACVACGDGAAQAAQEQAIQKGTKAAIANAVDAASAAGRDAAIAEGKRSKTTAQRQADLDAAAKAAAAADKAADDAEAALKKAEAEMKTLEQKAREAGEAAAKAAKAAGKSDAEAKAAYKKAYNKVMGIKAEELKKLKAKAEALRNAADDKAKSAKGAQKGLEKSQGAAKRVKQAKSDPAAAAKRKEAMAKQARNQARAAASKAIGDALDGNPRQPKRISGEKKTNNDPVVPKVTAGKHQSDKSALEGSIKTGMGL